MQATNIFVVIFIATISFSRGQPVSNSSETNGGGTIKLTFLGTVESKSYFTDYALTNWAGAKAYCTETGMHLATITTLAQWNFLASAHHPDHFDSKFWISLRDSHQPRQFSWDLLKTEPSITIGILWDDANNHVGDAYNTCVTFNSKSAASLSALNVEKCDTQRRVLCET